MSGHAVEESLFVLRVPLSYQPAGAHALESNLATIPSVKTLYDLAAQQEIRQRLASVRSDSPHQWGRMTAHQMICHLTDSFRTVMGDAPLSSGRGPLPGPIIKFIALKMPMKWPHGVKTRPEIDQEIGGTRPVEFAADRDALKFQFERFVSNSHTVRPAHPIFGPMSEWDWMRWGYLHMDHHLRQFGE
jgi:hypothetical protein